MTYLDRIAEGSPGAVRLEARGSLAAAIHTFYQPPLRRAVGGRQTRAWAILLYGGRKNTHAGC